MKIPFYMVRDSDQIVLGIMWLDDPDVGPVVFQASAPDGVTLYAGGADFSRDDYPDGYVATWVNGAVVWADPVTLEELRAAKVEEMSQACAGAILAGFVSSALGEAHTYPAKLTDQANLSASVLASILPDTGPDWSTPFWCADAAGAWEFRPHTGPQIRQVGVDAKVAVLNCMTINQKLAAQIVTASANQLATMKWPT